MSSDKNSVDRGAACAAGVAALVLILAVPALAPGAAAESDDEVTSVIAEILAVGRHPDLRWPDFSDVRDEVARYYAEDDGSLQWLGDRPVVHRTRFVGSVLAAARAKGLDPLDFDGSEWEALFARHDAGALAPRELALADVGLTICAVRYVSALHHGRVNPRQVAFEFDVADKRQKLWEFLDEVDDSGDKILGQLEPSLPSYRNLIAQLPRFQRLADEFPWRRVADDVVIRPGDRFADADYLATLLVALGDLPGDGTSDFGEQYTGALVDAVENLQTRFGLTADGIMGKKTYAALNTPPADLVRKIELTLERLRWFDDLDDEPFIAVNVPGFELHCIESVDGVNTSVLTMDVIVGQDFPEKQTPIFAESMTYLDFSPYWNVPPSIARRSLIPAIAKDPGELERRDLEIVPHFGNHVKPLPPTAENRARVIAGELQLRQRPGPRNALGLVKFIMPNAHSVYLHSTPQVALFGRDRRAYSSGCIRVAQPVELAAYVLRNQEGWNRERIVAAMEAGAPTRVILKKPRWVLLFYGTALADPAGRVFFYEDIYGHDETLRQALAGGFPYPR